MITSHELTAILTASPAREAFRATGAVVAYLFGSYARGAPAPESDVDIGVVFPPDTPAMTEWEGCWSLAARLQPNLPCRAGVVPLNQGTPLLQFEGIRHGCVLCCADDAQRLAFERRVLRALDEFLHILSIHMNALRTRLAA